jgi:predicted dehydrogenase
MPDQAPLFRWAILGTGAVARKFVLDLRILGDHARVVTVASRAVDNAERFARDLGISNVAPDYRAAVAADVDAVYIATPPALHEDHALMAIAAGKATLIEKPLALDGAAACRIADAAQAANVFCMEAMWTRFQPLLRDLRDRIAAGGIGEVRGFDGSFLGVNIPDPDTSLFDPARGGGALMHRGIYPLSIARFLLGPVVESCAMGRIGTTGVDEDSALILRHESGALTTLRSSLRANGKDGATIYGTAGTLHITGPIWRPTGAVLVRTQPHGARGGPRRFEAFRESGAGLRLSGMLGQVRGTLGRGQQRIRVPFAGNGYHYEAQAVMEAVQGGQTQAALMPLSESIEIMEIIDRARADWAAEGRT